MLEALGSFILTAFLLLGTPGPAPLALAATGAMVGFRRGLPFLFGILCGLACVIVLSATGIAALFESLPTSRLIVQICGALYIGYVAYKIATAPVLGNQSDDAPEPIFRDGFILNLLNVKAYAIFVALFSQIQLPMSSAVMSTVIIGLIAFAVAVVVDIIWLSLGEFIRPLFMKPLAARVTRITFAILMIASLLLTFRSG